MIGMIRLEELEQYLNELLNTSAFDDYCVNGVQIEGKQELNRIIIGVSASARLFEAALNSAADAVLVHHGLFWRNSPHPMALRGIIKQRVKLLLDADVSLLGYHLPLDAHPELGNNAQICQRLELNNVSHVTAGDLGNPIAAVGELSEAITFDDFRHHADEILQTTGLGLNFSRVPVQKVFVLAGGGGNYYPDAVKAGADVMVTGELREENVRGAEEHGLSLYAAGHYNSEKWGIKALGEHLREKFNLDVEFLDIPNPV